MKVTGKQVKDSFVLGIEASYDDLSLAIYKEGKPTALIVQNAKAKGMEILLPSLEQILLLSQIELTTLDAICINQGPGSYTGLRIALASAQALAWSLRIPLLSTTSFLIYLRSITYFKSTLYVVLPAYKGELFCATFVNVNQDIQQEGEIRISTVEAFLESLQVEDTVCGLAITTVIKKQGYTFPEGVCVVDPYQRPVNANDVVCALQDESIPEYNQILPIEPLYIRETDAAVEYNKRFQT